MEQKVAYDVEAVEQELDDALTTLRGPAIEIERPRTEAGFDEGGRPVKVLHDPWVKFGVLFGRGGGSLLRKMKGSDLKVFMAVALRINENFTCWPGIDTIAEDTGLHRTSVIRATEHLVEIGLLEVGKIPGRVNTYTVMGFVAYGRETPDQSQNATRSTHATPTRSVHATPPVAPTLPEEEPVRRTKEEEPHSPAPFGGGERGRVKRFRGKPEPEYVELDEEGYPEKSKAPIIGFIESTAQRRLTPTQQSKLAKGVQQTVPYPAPAHLYDTDPLFRAWLGEQIRWANGYNGDGRKQTGSLISAIRNYEREGTGWLEWKQQKEEHERQAGGAKDTRGSAETNDYLDQLRSRGVIS